MFRIAAAVTTDVGTAAVQVAAGDKHTCSLDANGNVWCWGDGGDGELGNGASNTSMTPVMSNATNVVQLSSGAGSSCAITSAMTVLCWGHGKFGELGDNNTKDNSNTPVSVIGL